MLRVLAPACAGTFLAVVGCDSGGGHGDGSGDGECAEPPCLGAPEKGFQVGNDVVMIEPGQDIEFCEVVQLPGGPEDTYYVNRFSSMMTRGSHHLLVAAIEPGSSTDANAQVGDRVECFGPASGFGGDLLDVTGQQLPYHEESFPPGVGKVFTGGQKLVFNYHYLNAGEEPIPAQIAVNFHTTEAANVQKIAGIFSFFFIGIDVKKGETADYTISCNLGTDVMVHKLTRHTHQWGTEFPVEFAGGERDGELIFTSPNYEDPDHIFDEPVLVQAGEGFRFTCNYDNTDGTHDLSFGENTTDEMCILFGTIFSPTARELPGSQGCFKVTAE